jgi:hypothetical protein
MGLAALAPLQGVDAARAANRRHARRRPGIHVCVPSMNDSLETTGYFGAGQSPTRRMVVTIVASGFVALPIMCG